jgi:nodulation protein E
MSRVLVTGLGVLCGLGIGYRNFSRALFDGRSAIRPLDLQVQDWSLRAVACAIDDDDFSATLSKSDIVELDRTVQLSVVAAEEAVRSSGLSGDPGLGAAGAIVGVSVGSWATLQSGFERVFSAQRARLKPNTIPKIMPNAASSAISMRYGLSGPSFAVSTACSSSNHALALAGTLIRSGQADIVLAGGADAPLTYSGLKSWSALRILAPDTCRPFSAERKGLVLGEGAAMFVLESEEHVKQRKARPIAELLGWSMNADGKDIVRPSLAGVSTAISKALADAKIRPGDVSYVNAHGTGTRINDQVEADALKQVFADSAAFPRISSTKSMHGHCLGAAGAVEVAACLVAMQENFIPPTANFLDVDPACDIDVTPNRSVEQYVDIAMSCSFAFGGLNSVIVLKNLSTQSES